MQTIKLMPRSSKVRDGEPGGNSRLMAPYPSVAGVSWGFEIPQTEKALVRVLNAIDVVVNT